MCRYIWFPGGRPRRRRASDGSALSELSSEEGVCHVSYHTIKGDIENAIPKRSRKKKTLAELKDEENSLLKEKRTLKRGIAALRINLEKQRAKHEKLKRIKVELQPLPSRKTSAMEQALSNHPQPETTVSHPTPPSVDAALCSTFVLPDLNMPFMDPGPDVLCGIS